MTTYKTNNPIGSTNPKDLYDNAQSLDVAVNDVANLTWKDRLGKDRPTLKGALDAVDRTIESADNQIASVTSNANTQIANTTNNANAIIASLGYQVPVDYAAGIELTLANQTVSFGGSTYAPVAGRLPFTTSGTFEADKFRLIQGVSGADLAAPTGASMVGLYNGWMLDDLETITAPTKAHLYGGQLRRLASALANPLHQAVNIAFIGDSITWGRWVPDNSAYEPRSQALTDPRDNAATDSYVNRVKRYIGAEFFDGTAPVLTNWSSSPSGQSTSTYSRIIELYPAGGVIRITSSGGTAVNDREAPLALFGRQYYASVPVGSGEFSLLFEMTGTEFSLVYSQAANGAGYEVIVNGVSQGVFTTDGVTAYKTYRKHSFSHIDNKTVEIRTLSQTGKNSFYVEGLSIEKKCRITNQGINGASFVSYADRCFGAFGPSVLSQNDRFFFVQLGTNDRGAGGSPPSISNLHNKASALVALLPGDVVLMAANPAATDYPTPPYAYNMNSVRNTINNLAREKSLDFIDNYAVFRGGDLSFLTADGLHPNSRGHSLIAKNIVSALEMA